MAFENAWMIYALVIFGIIFGGWLLLFAVPFLIKMLQLTVNVASLPFKAVTGRAKKGVGDVSSSGKKLFSK